MSFKKYASIDVLEHVSSRDDNDHRGNVILFHGYGANAQDLYPLAQFMDIPGIRWIFPDGTEKDGFGFGRAWFPINIERLQNLQNGAPSDRARNDLDAPVPPQLIALRGKITEMMKSMHLDPKKTVIGGFSQGSMVALDYILHSPATMSAFAGALLWSSSMVGENMQKQDFWEKAVEKPHPFLQSHGKKDEVLPFSRAEKLYQKLKDSKWNGDFHTFNGGHEIPPDLINKSKSFIDRCF